MTNPLVDARIEVPDDCPITCQRQAETGSVRFVLGGIQDALDVPLDMVFGPGALRRFVALAADMITASASDGTPP